ncbi:hypothetical protein N9J31_01360 [Pontimonas sp.]|nr:hypothetical protein [Pontimonas sp.]MDA9114501.1 hypothetical protein [Pontimonas sp.]
MATSPLDSAIQSQRSEKKSKRGILYTALLGVAGLGAASSVFAASISLNSGSAISFSQATQTIAACDTDGIAASLGSAYNNSASEFLWNDITLTDVDSGCNDKSIDIQIWSSSAKLVTITGTVAASSDGTTLSVVADDDANGIVTQASVTKDGSAETDTWTAIDGTIATTYESSIDAGDVATSGARVVIEIN